MRFSNAIAAFVFLGSLQSQASSETEMRKADLLPAPTSEAVMLESESLKYIEVSPETDRILIPDPDGQPTEGRVRMSGPIAVFGRGVQDRDSGKVIQLACVEKDDAGISRCRKARFIETDQTGETWAFGDVYRIDGSIDARGQFTAKMKEKLKEMRKGNRFEPFYLTKTYFFGGVSSYWFMPLFCVAAAAKIVATGGTVLFVAPIIAFGFLPTSIDIAMLPFGLGVRILKGDLLIRSPEMRIAYTIEDRPRHWQFRPKRISSKKFSQFQELLATTVISTAKVKPVVHVRGFGGNLDEHRMQVVHLDGSVGVYPTRETVFILHGPHSRNRYEW